MKTPHAAIHEPAPVRNDLPCIQDLVAEELYAAGFARIAKDILFRKDEGVKKYGTVLQPRNGRNPIMDTYQEVLDGMVYMRQAIWEESRSSHPVNLDKLNESYAQLKAVACRLRTML
jgi:hypothetical protein